MIKKNQKITKVIYTDEEERKKYKEDEKDTLKNKKKPKKSRYINKGD